MNGYNIIWLDDIREVPQKLKDNKEYDVIHVRNFDQFVKYIETKGLPNFISFDHDLGEEKDGYDCAKFLVQYCMNKDCDIPDYEIHSANPVGTKNISSYLNCYHRSFYNS